MKPLTRIITPTGMLGYGYPLNDFLEWVEQGIDAIVVDSGSTDPGPYQLGLGATLVGEDAYESDLRPMLRVVGDRRIPLLISSAGGAGTNVQVDQMVALVERIAGEEGLSLRVASIYADISPAVASKRLAAGAIAPNVRGELPSERDIESTEALVAQMGAAPFAALVETAGVVDVIVAGRAYDPAPHAAWSMHHGVQPGIAWHSGKILECGGACCEPKGGGVIATLYEDAFELTPMSPWQAATPLSVAAHSLYEKSRPDLLPGPDGVLDVRECRYEAIDERSVRVTGSRHIEPEHPTVKLEGASVVGHRATFIGGVRDPILIGQLDAFLDGVRKAVAGRYPGLQSGAARLIFHVYGRNAVMEELEPSASVAHEVGILGEVTAPTPELAKSICGLARIATLHLPYPGQLATAGNLALPLTPIDNPIGPVCAFTVYHVMQSEGLDLFPARIRPAIAS